MKPAIKSAESAANSSLRSALAPFFGLAALLLISGCTTVERSAPPAQTSTTTEHTIISRPMSGVTETQTTRNY